MNQIGSGQPAQGQGTGLPRLHGGTPDNPMAMGIPGGPPVVTLPLHPIRMGTVAGMDAMRHMTAPVTVVAEVDASNLKALHDWIKPHFESQTGIPLTYTSFFARATILGLQAVPIMNSIMSPAGHHISRTINLGIATQVPGGVVIPTIFSAETKNIPEMAKELRQIAQRAKAGKMMPMESNAATFCITNTGKYGATLFGTPTIKSPNVGVLAFEAIKKRPVVLENDEVVARPVMHLALTADHRAVDGQDMTQFITKVKEALENLTF
jgi:2-oxoisovalerate dehydrogenase E2 component (dihydrolipoyl transacylase)